MNYIDKLNAAEEAEIQSRTEEVFVRTRKNIHCKSDPGALLLRAEIESDIRRKVINRKYRARRADDSRLEKIYKADCKRLKELSKLPGREGADAAVRLAQIKAAWEADSKPVWRWKTDGSE